MGFKTNTGKIAGWLRSGKFSLVTGRLRTTQKTRFGASSKVRTQDHGLPRRTRLMNGLDVVLPNLFLIFLSTYNFRELEGNINLL